MKTTLILALALPLVGACSRGENATPADSSSSTASTSAAPKIVRGAVVSATGSALVLQSDSGQVTITLARPYHVFSRAPGSLSDVKQSTFIGVTTVKQPDGSEQATEIHIFPEELRGLGEGSRMMAPAASATASRMTNGNVSASRMTNGSASPSRMSNGNVSSTNGSTLVVEYKGGSQTVTVPPNTPVTEMKETSKPLAVGDRVSVPVKKAADGTLTSDKVLLSAAK
jgi:hypothetical protein